MVFRWHLDGELLMVEVALLVGLSLFLLVLRVLGCSVGSVASPSFEWHAATFKSPACEADGPL